MRNKYLLPLITISILVNLLWAWQVWAGNLDSPGAPNITSSYTLQDLYNRLTAGTPGTPRVFTEPSAAPGIATMRTLNEIMSVAPAVDYINGAAQAQVMTGATYWGLRSGAWGLQTGTMPDNGAVALAPAAADVPIAQGYHNGSGYVQGDIDLAAANIRQGVNLFGVEGAGILASGNAAPGQVLNGISFSNSSGAATGTMPDNGAVTLVPTTTNVAIAQGYHNGSGYVQGDADLAAANIRQGVDLFGVDGTLTTSRVPKTGNAYNDNDVTGEDGELQQGTAWPNPRFTDNGNGTVTDNLTGLIWLRNANCANAWRLWEDALSDVASLNSTGTMNGHNCGDTSNGGSHQTDWRLPNVRELHSLVHYGYTNRAVPDTAGTGKWWEGNPFNDLQSAQYWSGTLLAGVPDTAWYVDLSIGRVNTAGTASNIYNVWAVRGGQ